MLQKGESPGLKKKIDQLKKKCFILVNIAFDMLLYQKPEGY